MDDKVKELLDRSPGRLRRGPRTRQSDRPGSREKGGQMVDVAKLNVQLFD